MFANKSLRGLRRRHLLNKAEVDRLPWPHPRPVRDPRIMSLHVAFVWTSIIQIIQGPPPSTVQSISFGYVATVVYSSLLILCSLMLLYAGYCRSQYNSFGWEMAATTGFSGVFLIYAAGAIWGVSDWYATQVAPLAIMLFLGNAWRAQTLIRRLW